MKEIRQNCRPCPECKSKIFKIAGCDTMWCTKCSSGFNWQTGMIITDVRSLHNPHYTEFMRNNPEFKYQRQRHDPTLPPPVAPLQQLPQPAPDENLCDQVTLENINYPTLQQINAKIFHLCVLQRKKFENMQQNMAHMISFSRKRFIRANVHDDIVYALRYLTKKWDEKRWRICLEHHDRFRQTNQEYIDVLITWLVVLRDLFMKLLTYRDSQYVPVLSSSTHNHEEEVPDRISSTEADHLFNQMNQISLYTNETLEMMNNIYKRKTEYVFCER